MTRRERLTRLYFHQEVDRPAVYSRAGFPGNDPGYDRLRAYLHEHTEMKGGWRPGHYETPLPVETRVEPLSDAWERHIHVLHTPKGDLEATRRASLKGQPGLDETYYIKGREDAEAYLSLPMPEWGGEVTPFADAQAQIGDRGIVDVGLGHNPAGVVATLCGSETFALMSITDRDILCALCERQMKITISRLKFYLDHGAGPFFSMAGQEYLTPPLHGPKDFYDFNVKYDKPIIDLVHNAGGRLHIHCHGSIKRVIQGFVDMGTDVLHPFEAPPMGDITPREAKDAARGKICLEGNIQIAHMYESTPDDIRRQTEALIREVFDDRTGLIVSPTASPYIRGAGEACFENYKTMIDTVTNWKA